MSSDKAWTSNVYLCDGPDRKVKIESKDRYCLRPTVHLLMHPIYQWPKLDSSEDIIEQLRENICRGKIS